MRVHRFFVNIELSQSDICFLPADAAHHCTQVLRYKLGQPLILFNGDGFNYHAQIHSLDKKTCQVTINGKFSPDNESPLKIHLFQGIAKGDKMDLIIQKAVELGVHQITPIFTQRCNVKLKSDRLEKKLAHWNKVLISACEQSGRAFVPKLNQAVDINKLETLESLSIYLEPNSKTSLTQLELKDKRETQSIGLFVGPEGGFSDDDIQRLEDLECLGARLGSRILRTETAGLAAVSVLQSLFGDL